MQKVQSINKVTTMYNFTESEKNAIMLAIGHRSRDCYYDWEAAETQLYKEELLEQITVYLSIANKVQPESFITMDIDEWYAEMKK